MAALARTAWAERAASFTPARRDEIAAGLGVTPDVLDEVKHSFLEQRKKAGVEPPRGVRRRETAKQLPQVQVRMPPDVLAAWKALAARQHMRAPALLRGAVHEYLTDGVEPASLDLRWVVDGKVYAVPAGAQVRGGTLSALVSVGARDAFNVKAQRAGVSRHTLLVGLCNDVLSRRRLVRRAISKRSMFSEAKRYLQ